MDHESQRPVEDIETPSKLQKAGAVALMVGVWTIPIVLGGGASYFNFKIVKMAHETAKLNLAAAKITAGK